MNKIELFNQRRETYINMFIDDMLGSNDQRLEILERMLSKDLGIDYDTEIIVPRLKECGLITEKKKELNDTQTRLKRLMIIRNLQKVGTNIDNKGRRTSNET